MIMNCQHFQLTSCKKLLHLTTISTTVFQYVGTLHYGNSPNKSRVAVEHGPGIESQWRRGFPHPSRTALLLTQPPIQRKTRRFPGHGVALSTYRINSRGWRKRRATVLVLLFCAFTACWRVNFTLAMGHSTTTGHEKTVWTKTLISYSLLGSCEQCFRHKNDARANCEHR